MGLDFEGLVAKNGTRTRTRTDVDLANDLQNLMRDEQRTQNTIVPPASYIKENALEVRSMSRITPLCT